MTARPTVLVTRPLFPEALERLRAAAEVDLVGGRDGLLPEALRERIRPVRGLICQLTDTIDAGVLEAAENLVVAATVAVGFDNIDVAVATARGIQVTNTPGVLTEATADLTMALLLAAARRIPEGDRFVRGGQWRQWEIDLMCGQDVHRRTLGIVGMGRIGRAVARRARGFGMQVLFWNRRPLDDEELRGLPARQVTLDELLAASDFVSLHVALSEETRHLIGAAELELMASHAVLVNTARGPVVDQEALIESLERGRIAAAGLDVFDDEPHVPEALLALENAVLAPHVGSATTGTRSRMCVMAADNVLAALRGERPPYLVNPEVLER